MQTQFRTESSYAIYRELSGDHLGDEDRQAELAASGVSSDMRHFMRLFLAVQAEMNQAMTTLSLDALQMKIQELMTAAEKIQDEGEKAAAAQRSAAIAAVVAGSYQSFAGSRSIRGGEAARTAAVESKVATARAAADPVNQDLLRRARDAAQAAANAESRVATARMMGESGAPLGNSIGNLQASQMNEEASSRRRDQKIAEAASARAEAQQSSASQSVQQNLQAAGALLQLYRELLQEKNQMEKIAHRVV
ncbi:MAG: hypothetical protein RL522_691 [Pseudomonadota bacterium]|jgi:hypothetical protein